MTFYQVMYLLGVLLLYWHNKRYLEALSDKRHLNYFRICQLFDNLAFSARQFSAK